MAIMTSSEKIGDKEYFQQGFEYPNDTKAMYSMYKFLKERNVPKRLDFHQGIRCYQGISDFWCSSGVLLVFFWVLLVFFCVIEHQKKRQAGRNEGQRGGGGNT